MAAGEAQQDEGDAQDEHRRRLFRVVGDLGAPVGGEEADEDEDGEDHAEDALVEGLLRHPRVDRDPPPGARYDGQRIVQEVVDASADYEGGEEDDGRRDQSQGDPQPGLRPIP